MSDELIPPRAPNGWTEVFAAYGDPKVQKNPNGWTVDAAWERDNTTIVAHPLLVGTTPHGRLEMHKLVAPYFLRMLDMWQARIDAGSAWRPKHFACFAPRAQRGSKGLVMSLHSLAIAFDVDPDENELIEDIDLEDPRRQTAKKIPDEFIADARKCGFFWGGDFQHRFDPMHFQLATGC